MVCVITKNVGGCTVDVKGGGVAIDSGEQCGDEDECASNDSDEDM